MVPIVMVSLICLMYVFLIISSHPLIMGASIIFQSMLFSVLISYSFLFSWFSFLIFIVYLGGILMLFSYIISMIPTTELLPKSDGLTKASIFTIFLVYSILNFNLMDLQNFLNFKGMEYQDYLFVPFSSSFKMSIFILIFLLMVMIVVVFLIESSKGTMRSI